MENTRCLVEYFVKGMPDRTQRMLAAEFKNAFTADDKVYILDSEKNFEKLSKISYFRENPARLVDLMSRYDAYFKNINNILKEGERNPLFKESENVVEHLAENLRWYEQLIKQRTEEECNEIMNCNSYENYQPQVYNPQGLQSES